MYNDFKKNIRLTKPSEGVERRKNYEHIIFDKRPDFPLTVELKDIDASFSEWVEKIDLSCNGKRLPTFKLFSNQRINEYAQTWQHLDDTGNLLMNFKTFTRESNPRKGTLYGDSFNIPNDRFYTLFYVPSVDKSGEPYMERYSRRFPFNLDLIYTVTIVCNQYELLNRMNQYVNKQFKGLQCYIQPNGFYMPMKLDDISDESDYSIDDRKYYSQSYKISLRAYIIEDDDYKVEKVPMKFFHNTASFNKFNYKGVKIEKYEGNPCNAPSEPKEQENEPTSKITLFYEPCENEITFKVDNDFTVDSITLTNIYDFKIHLNGEFIEIDDETTIVFEKDDEIKIGVTKKNEEDPSTIIFLCYSDGDFDISINEEY